MYDGNAYQTEDTNKEINVTKISNGNSGAEKYHHQNGKSTGGDHTFELREEKKKISAIEYRPTEIMKFEKRER